MSTTNAIPPAIRHLDTLRQRLQQLSQNLNAARYELTTTPLDDLPPLATLTTTVSLLYTQLLALMNTLRSEEVKEQLGYMHPHPLPGYPVQQHAIILQELLRRKMGVEGEGWVEEGRRAGEGVGMLEDGHQGADGEVDVDADDAGKTRALSVEQLRELWQWAAPAQNEVARQVIFGEDEDEEEEGEDEEDETGEDEEDETGEDEGGDEVMEDVGSAAAKKANIVPATPARPMMKLDDVLRFVSTGREPPVTV
ncbi:hypothetical protein LTS18_011213 [Coniosporium uncinatum]|uniref:Uncharacterized protein n=1 Tax=Coniosporium uncinatum TaxID=93489 RepID=A0ACC3DKS4_9PEZI|nr:hypothetical protein LTS18_011213 [Coniosporium uncinatum]